MFCVVHCRARRKSIFDQRHVAPANARLEILLDSRIDALVRAMGQTTTDNVAEIVRKGKLCHAAALSSNYLGGHETTRRTGHKNDKDIPKENYVNEKNRMV